MNVREMVDIILAVNGGRKFEKTCDQLIEGSWDRQVTGVAVTFMATVDVIHRAAGIGCNLIITHEPTYFTGQDRLEWLKDDPVYHEKKTLIDAHRISIWRYHDHMHHGNTDLIYDGLLKDLGWTNYLDTGFPLPHCYNIPAISLTGLIALLKDKLDLKVVRVVGDLETQCRRVGILVGGGSLGLGEEEMPARLMHDRQLDVIICGDIMEWTLSAYVRDAAALSHHKAMIVIGHERSEYSGMKEMAKWLPPLVGNIPVHFIDDGEPFIYL